MNLSSRGVRVHFSVAFALVSVIPCLTLVYVTSYMKDMGEVNLAGLAVIGFGVMLPMYLGYLLLVRYPVAIMRLRNYLNTMITGKLPDAVSLQVAESDIVDIERALSRIIVLLGKKLHDSENERGLLQEELLQSQKLEAVGTLASGVAHEINNPINGIMNYAQLMLDESAPGSSLSVYAKEIEVESQRIAKIVRNLLSFARQDDKSYQIAPVDEMIDSVLSLTCAMMRKERVNIQVDIQEELPAIKCRTYQIQQVLMNLLTNACDAIKGREDPSESCEKQVLIHASSYNKDDGLWVRITVEDSGVGISDEAKDQIFNPFFTTKTQGAGLGLSVSHGIVKAHGGRLICESELGKGSKFHFDLPVCAAEAA